MINTIRLLSFLLLFTAILLNSCCKKHGGSGKGSHVPPNLPILEVVFVDCEDSVKANPDEKCLHYTWKQEDFSQKVKPITMHISVSFPLKEFSEEPYIEKILSILLALKFQ